MRKISGRFVGNSSITGLWFAAAAMGYGRRRQGFQMAVAGDPRNRDLAFAALLQLARWFNPEFEQYAEDREVVSQQNTGHHWDYDKPKDVFWLCREHHNDVHKLRITLLLPAKPKLPAV